MRRSVSVRFDAVLDLREREAVARALTSLGAVASSWCLRAQHGRTYASVQFASEPPADELRRLPSAARVDDPALVVVEVTPAETVRIPALMHALGGPGRPVGVIDALLGAGSVTVELDSTATPLSLIVDLIDVELRSGPRRIEPLLPLTDTALAALAAAALGEPSLDASRMIETYTEPLLEAEST